MQKFWNWIRNDVKTEARELRLEGEISSEVWWGNELTPADFRDQLNAGSGDITVWINSPGGDVFAAAEIYTMLKEYANRHGSVTVKIDAIAASAASVIAMAGDIVQMSPVAMLMIHDPMTLAYGNEQDMSQAISVLKQVKESIINAYKAKTGLSHNKIAELMSNETWMNAKMAVELGFADEVLYSKKIEEPEKEEPEKEEQEEPEKEAPIPETPEEPEEPKEPEEEEEEKKKPKQKKKSAPETEAHLYSRKLTDKAMMQRLLSTLSAPKEDKAVPSESKTQDGSVSAQTLLDKLELLRF